MFEKFVSKTVIEKSSSTLLINYYPIFVWVVAGGSMGQCTLYLLIRMVHIALSSQDSYYAEAIKFVKFELLIMMSIILISLFFLVLMGPAITIEFNKQSHKIMFIRQLFCFKKIKEYAIENFVSATLSETQEANEIPYISLSFRLNRKIWFLCIVDGHKIIGAIADFMS